MVDVGSEWRTFSNDKDSKDMSRVGAAENPLFGGDNLETYMSLGTGSGAVDEFGKQKYGNGPRQMSSADKALRSGYDAVRQMAGRINLSSRIISRAFSLFKQCYQNKCVRGRSQDAIVATCIYIACRQEGSQRTIKEICAISTSASKKDIGRCFKQIVQNLPNNRPESIDIKNLVVRNDSNSIENDTRIFVLLSLVSATNSNSKTKFLFKKRPFMLPNVPKKFAIFKVVHRTRLLVHRFTWHVLLLANENQ